MNGTKTPLSLNEIRFFFTRAAVGAGAPFGLGEDFANAAIWLAGQGLDPAELVAPALSALAGGNSSSRIVEHKNGDTVSFSGEGDKPLSALYAGPAIADRLGAAAVAGQKTTIISGSVDQPALIAAYIGAAKLERGLVSVSSAVPASLTVEYDPWASTPSDGNEAKMSRHLLEYGVNVAAGPWETVFDSFRKCLVPSSSQSREQGAGAGLTDND